MPGTEIGLHKYSNETERNKFKRRVNHPREVASDHLLVRSRKRRLKTTNSYHWLRKYPNLNRRLVPTSNNQLWVSGIAYWKLEENPEYISFINDAYFHKIAEYQVAYTMEVIETARALQMAISSFGADRQMN